MIATAHNNDLQLIAFMQALAKAVRGHNGLILPQWESNFLASFCSASRQTLWFTPARRVAADKMWLHYGGEKDINLPHPSDTVTKQPAVAPADVGCCMYFVRLDGRQQRCNGPAVWQRPGGGFLYCNEHGEAVERETKRLKNPVKLMRYP